jgi:hypothetical protein
MEAVYSLATGLRTAMLYFAAFTSSNDRKTTVIVVL